MYNAPTRSELEEIPPLYATEGIPLGEKTLYMKFFIGDFTWYPAEYDGESEEMFGYVDRSDKTLAEWGYFNFRELHDLAIHGLEVDRDLDFTPRRAREIDGIKLYEDGR